MAASGGLTVTFQGLTSGGLVGNHRVAHATLAEGQRKYFRVRVPEATLDEGHRKSSESECQEQPWVRDLENISKSHRRGTDGESPSDSSNPG